MCVSRQCSAPLSLFIVREEGGFGNGLDDHDRCVFFRFPTPFSRSGSSFDIAQVCSRSLQQPASVVDAGSALRFLFLLSVVVCEWFFFPFFFVKISIRIRRIGRE